MLSTCVTRNSPAAESVRDLTAVPRVCFSAYPVFLLDHRQPLPVLQAHARDSSALRPLSLERCARLRLHFSCFLSYAQTCTVGPFFVAFPNLRQAMANNTPIKTEARDCTILPNFVGCVVLSNGTLVCFRLTASVCPTDTAG